MKKRKWVFMIHFWKMIGLQNEGMKKGEREREREMVSKKEADPPHF